MEIRPVKRSGMLTFAGVMLILAGSFNLLDGVVALTKDELFRADQLLFGDLSAWGILVAVHRPAAGVGGRPGRTAARRPASASASGSPG